MSEKEEWRLLDLGALDALGAQTLYEAVALAVDRGHSPNTIVLCHPREPYVCIGFHQELEREVDLAFCREHGLPIIRRPLGGGATYLDSGQQFYQIVASEECRLVPMEVEGLFRRFLQPTIHTYRRLGVPAEYKPLNDVIVSGRKISGNGAGKIGDTTALIGNVIFDLDYETMARVLKVPDEKFRDRLAKSMREWVSSLKKELGYTPPREEVKRLLVEGYEKIGIELSMGTLSGKERRIFEEEVRPKHLSEEWLYMPELRHPELTQKRVVKVTGNVRIVEADHKARKLIRVTMEIAFDRIGDILISGDFFMLPEGVLQELEGALVGAPLERGEVLRRVELFYARTGVQTPGIVPEDFAEAVMKAVGS
ncbi:MAG: hypothetical protein ACE5Z5_14425 [Candidatus Bathyarchaeia archaeon]